MSAVFRSALASGFIALLIAGMPSVGQTIFWASGAISSLFPVFGGICLLALLMSPPGRQRRAVLMSLICFTAFLTGLHEVFGLVLCITLGLGSLARTARHHPDRFLWVTVFVAAVAGTAIVSFAPGVQNRVLVQLSGIPHVSRLAILFHFSKDIFAQVLREWLLDVKLVAATLVFVWHPAVREHRPFAIRRFGWIEKTLLLTGCALVTSVPLVLPSLMVSKILDLPGRTLGGLYALFLMSWFTTVFVFTRPDKLGVPDDSRLGSWTRMFAGIVLAASLLHAPNTMAMYHDLKSTVIPWRISLARRFDAIREAKRNGRPDLVVTSLAPVTPLSFFYQDAEVDPRYFCNLCIAQYYGLRTVATMGTQGSLRK